MKLEYTLDPSAVAPSRAHDDDAGLDLAIPHQFTVYVRPGGVTIVNTGVAVNIPRGHVGLVFVRSSIGITRRVVLANGTGVIDSGYTGHIKLALHNLSDEDVVFYGGERVAQLVVLPIALPTPVEVDELPSTPRGTGGIGSTGE